NHGQRCQAWNEEIISAAQLDETRYPAAEKRRALRIGRALHHESTRSVVVSHQQILVVTQVRIVAVLDPLLLHKLELPADAGVECHENDAALVFAPHRLALGNILAVSESPPHDAAAIAQAAVKPERIARMHTPDMRSDGTAHSRRIGAVS